MNFIILLLSLVLLILLLIGAISPRKYWEIFDKWRSKREPSAAYFVLIRIAFIISIVVYIYILVFMFNNMGVSWVDLFFS